MTVALQSREVREEKLDMAQVVGYVASAISLFSILSCFVYVPYMCSKLGDIRTSLDLKMDEFKVLESDVWSEIMQARVNVPKPRKERQAGPQCNCDSTERCPPGPPGASGMLVLHKLPRIQRCTQLGSSWGNPPAGQGLNPS